MWVYVVILSLAVLAGVLVYQLSLRLDRAQESAAEPEARTRRPPRRRRFRRPAAQEPSSDPAQWFVYVPTGAPKAPLRTRLLGVLGLLGLIVVSAVTIAAALWETGRIINEQIARFFQR